MSTRTTAVLAVLAAASRTDQPVTCWPPDRIGVWPSAACHVTWWPAPGESAAVNVRGEVSR